MIRCPRKAAIWRLEWSRAQPITREMGICVDDPDGVFYRQGAADAMEYRVQSATRE